MFASDVCFSLISIFSCAYGVQFLVPTAKSKPDERKCTKNEDTRASANEEFY
jgi:hypothetical protein